MISKKIAVPHSISLLFLFFTLTAVVQGQVRPIVYFDPYDCPNCSILFNLIGDRLKAERAEVILAQPFKNKQDRFLLEKKYAFLKENPVHNAADHYFKDAVSFPSGGTLAIAVDSQLVWQKAIKNIKNVEHYFELLARSQERAVVPLDILLSSSLQFFPVTDQKVILADALSKQLLFLDIQTAEQRPVQRLSIKELYQASGFGELYPAYQKKLTFIETYGLDSITFKQARTLNDKLYLSYSLPWFYKTDSSENLSSVQILLELDTGDFSSIRCYGFEKKRGIKEYYSPYFQAPCYVNKNRYLLQVRKEQDFTEEDAWLAWYKLENGTLNFDGLMDLPYPEECNNTHHQTGGDAFQADNASLALAFHPCILDIEKRRYIDLEFPKNDWNGTGLEQHRYSLMTFRSLEKHWELIVFLAEEKAFYWVQVGKNGQTIKQKRLLEQGIEAAAFVGEQLLLKLSSGQLVRYPIAAFTKNSDG